ncbi:hypothetical protein DXT74_14845 [Chromobacterium sp. Rain0013]|nr:hypothetical protein DXT74_14845 [Chromobacterium sp. Rain0013]
MAFSAKKDKAPRREAVPGMLGQALNPRAQPGGFYVVMASRAQILARSTAPQKIFRYGND